MYNSAFWYSSQGQTTSVRQCPFPLQHLFFGRKESEQGLIQQADSLFYYSRNDNVSREHFRLSFGHSFDSQFELLGLLRLLHARGVSLEQVILKTLVAFLGEGLFIKVKEMGSLFGSWLVGYRRKPRSRQPGREDSPEKESSEPVRVQARDQIRSNFRKKSIGQSEHIRQSRRAHAESENSNSGLTRLVRGFTYRASNGETVEIYQILKKRGRQLKRERLEHVLDLEDYFASNRVSETPAPGAPTREQQSYRKFKSISETEVFESVRELKAIMSNRGELEVAEFKSAILPELLSKSEFDFDLVLIKFDSSSQDGLETDIALLVVNQSTFRFRVKSFSIVFQNDTFYLQKSLGLGSAGLARIDGLVHNFELESNTVDLNNFLFQTPRNRMKADVETEVHSELGKERVALGFSIRKNRRFIPNSWLLKVDGVGQLTFLVNNLLIKLNFWH